MNVSYAIRFNIGEGNWGIDRPTTLSGLHSINNPRKLISIPSLQRYTAICKGGEKIRFTFQRKLPRLYKGYFTQLTIYIYPISIICVRTLSPLAKLNLQNPRLRILDRGSARSFMSTDLSR